MLPYILLIIGFVFLIKGADFLVAGASSVARRFNISDLAIGLTVVAFGTSTPELFVNIVAGAKGTTDIAIGNVVGSNIFNIFFVLGISSIVHPLPFSVISNLDLGMVIPASLLLFIFMFTGKKRSLDRWEGVVSVGIYFIYIIFLIYR
jgi:cation:H+ antiporter